jgi:hypothetical protein
MSAIFKDCADLRAVRRNLGDLTASKAVYRAFHQWSYFPQNCFDLPQTFVDCPTTHGYNSRVWVCAEAENVSFAVVGSSPGDCEPFLQTGKK